ncbi:hypothetical protein ACFX2G_035283 [Malus domestica]
MSWLEGASVLLCMLKQWLIGPTTLVLAQLQRNCIIWLMYTLMPFSFLNVWRRSRFSSNRAGKSLCFHSELNDPSEDISYQGVVFNQRKEFYSRPLPEDILKLTAQQASFPSTLSSNRLLFMFVESYSLVHPSMLMI